MYYIKDNRRWRQGTSIVLDGRRIFNPSHEQLLAAGYEAREEQPYVPTVEDIRARKLSEIDAYDSSEAVNGFELDGQTAWLSFEERSRLRQKIEAEEAVGRETTVLWLGTQSFTMPIAVAKALIAQIEVYAGDCYNVTAAHRKAVEALDTAEAIESYDHTQGYPERLTVNTQGA